MNFFKWLWLFVVVIFGLIGCRQSVSGSYVLQSKGNAELLQLTETPDKRLIGTIQSITLLDSGVLSRSTSNLSGAVDGDNLTISIESSTYGASKRNLSGRVSGQSIDLIVPASEKQLSRHAVFTKADEAKFEAASKELAAISQSLLEEKLAQQKSEAVAKALQERIGQINSTAVQLAKDLSGVSGNQNQLAKRADAIHKQYADYVGRARAHLRQQRQFLNMNTVQSKAKAIGENSHILYLTSRAKNLDQDVRSSYAKWDRVFANMEERISTTEQDCQVPPINSSTTLVGHPEECQLTSKAIAAYRTALPQLKATIRISVDSMAQAFGELAAIKNESDSLLK